MVVADGMDDTDGGSTVEGTVEGETERPRSDTMSSQDSGIGSQEFEMLELTETEVASEGRPVSLDLTKLSRSISLDMSSRSSCSSSTGSSSTMDTSELSELGSIPDLKQVAKVQEMCMFCEMRPRNAIFIHGKLGHQVCLKTILLEDFGDGAEMRTGIIKTMTMIFFEKKIVMKMRLDIIVVVKIVNFFSFISYMTIINTGMLLSLCQKELEDLTKLPNMQTSS